MRKLMCIIIAICLTATMGITITAVQTTDVQLSETIMQTYNYDGRPAYYLHTAAYTVNAVLIDNTIEIYYGDHRTNSVYVAEICCDETDFTNDELTNPASWFNIIESASENAELVGQESLSANASIMNPPVAETQDTYDDWLEIMVNEFGPVEGFSYLRSGSNSIATVDIYEAHTYQFYDNGLTTCPAGKTLQYCATLVGCAYAPLGDFLGLVFDACVPVDTNIYYATISVNDVRQGRINGTPYYNVIHEVAYPAFDDVTGPREPYVCFDYPEFDLYSDPDGLTESSTIYTSTASIVNKTTAVYANE